jgi:hypothetical protein
LLQLIAKPAASVQHEITHAVDQSIREILALAAAGAAPDELERKVGAWSCQAAKQLLAAAFSCACEGAMKADLEERGLQPEQIRVRPDADAFLSVNTTFGPVRFPAFAYRVLSSPLASVTRYPARRVFPYHARCRSSPLCLEWTARLGARMPFRKAEELFACFTRGAGSLEDTTIERHLVTVSSMVTPDWLYLKPETIQETLRNRATRDRKSGRPLLYFSTDAHALRRYANETWNWSWKMTNGIRLWCEDARTGSIIHLGGEFTWGDCREVAERFRTLLSTGILPNDDEAWRAIDPQLVFISDSSFALHAALLVAADTPRPGPADVSAKSSIVLAGSRTSSGANTRWAARRTSAKQSPDFWEYQGRIGGAAIGLACTPSANQMTKSV